MGSVPPVPPVPPPSVAATAAGRTVSERLADHVVDLRVEDLPADVVGKTKDLLVHHFGVAFRGHGDPDCRRAVAVARDLSGTGGDCTVIGERPGFDPLAAAFANSFLMGHWGLDDYYLPAGVHTGVITQPAAWALAERTGAPGREVLAAVVAGYDVMGKLAGTAWTWSAESLRRPNSVFASFGGAAVAARLLGLSREQTALALAHAAHAGLGIVEGGEFMQPLHPLMVRSGVTAAILAKGGMPMVRTMIEGDHGLFRSYFGRVPESLEVSLATLGHDFEVMKARTKRYRASGLNIVPMQLTLRLVEEHALTADDVAGIEVTVPAERERREGVWEAGLARPAPTASNRAASLRFQLAIIVADGRIDPARYEQPADEALERLLAKVRLCFEPGHPQGYARIEVVTASGDRYRAEGDEHVFPEPGWDEWLAEGRRFLATAQLTRLAELIDGLEDLDDAGEVMACVVPADGGAR